MVHSIVKSRLPAALSFVYVLYLFLYAAAVSVVTVGGIFPELFQ
jgi:hypothetical protein